MAVDGPSEEVVSVCPNGNCRAPVVEVTSDEAGTCSQCRQRYSTCRTCQVAIALLAMQRESKIVPDACHNCWEVESRIRSYLKSERGREIVQRALEAARAS